MATENQKLRLCDFTDGQLAAALHFIEGHEDGFEPIELRAWRQVKETILHAAETAREMDVE